MVGLKECILQGIKVSSKIALHPSALFRESLSVRTQLVLEVAMGIAIPESTEESPELFRLVSNLIYFANNYFDIGLPAQQGIYRNKPSQFVAQEYIYHETRREMLHAAEDLIKEKPDAKTLIENFIQDGSALFVARRNMSTVAYREIDSGVTALLIFGVIGGPSYLENLSVVPTAAHTTNELIDKYKMFQLSTLDIEDVTFSNEERVVIGMQAIEMILSCLDCQWGQEEDKLLGLPSNGGAKNISQQIDYYKKIAEKCGFSHLLTNAASVLVYAHKLRVNSIKNGDAIELHEIQRHHNIGKIFLLREWLNTHSLLDGIMR